ncbi:MAG: radical SAM protein [Synergistaceae bacterium]|nr:radical SAM protein [Synergistaceae bacterium]
MTDWGSWSDYRALENPTVILPKGGDMPCALFYPADYSIGMANLGFHYIYRALREQGVAVERFFASPIRYRSVEKDTLLERFPLILGSVSYEADVPLFAKWLAEGGINPSRKARGPSNRSPVIGAGGAVTYINPLMLSGICDFIVLGDGVAQARYLVETARRGLPREKALAALAENRSIFVPSIHEAGRHLLDISKGDISGDYGRGTWTTPRAAFGNTLLLELQRGCARGCRFCTLPSCFGPARVRGVSLVKRDMMESGLEGGFAQIGLVTPEAGDYKDLDELLEFAERHGKGVSFASLRADGITERMMRAVLRAGRHSLTIAPETGDDGLRERCGKRFTNSRVIEALKMASQIGAKNAKLYFMTGLPGETDENIVSISRLCASARNETGLRITAAVSPFVPKPRTPWAGEEFAGEEKLKRAHSLLSKTLRGVAGVKLQVASIKEACMEYAISWAGAPASDFIAEAALNGNPYRALKGMVDKREVGSEFARLGLGGFPQ